MKTVPLTKGKFALVDDADFEAVMRWKWQAWKGKNHKSWYAMRRFRSPDHKRHTVFLHQFLVKAPMGLIVDHRNHDGLDCQRNNLRVCTHSQNCMNRTKRVTNKSGFKGVSFFRQSSKWRAVIRVMGKDISLGLHATPELAHAAYCAGAIKHHGEFARFE